MTPAELFGVNQSFWPRNFVVENWSKALGATLAARSQQSPGQYRHFHRDAAHYSPGRLRARLEKANRSQCAFLIHAA